MCLCWGVPEGRRGEGGAKLVRALTLVPAPADSNVAPESDAEGEDELRIGEDEVWVCVSLSVFLFVCEEP